MFDPPWCFRIEIRRWLSVNITVILTRHPKGVKTRDGQRWCLTVCVYSSPSDLGVLWSDPSSSLLTSQRRPPQAPQAVRRPVLSSAPSLPIANSPSRPRSGSDVAAVWWIVLVLSHYSPFHLVAAGAESVPQKPQPPIETLAALAPAVRRRTCRFSPEFFGVSSHSSTCDVRQSSSIWMVVHDWWSFVMRQEQESESQNLKSRTCSQAESSR
jgi:hypothetical protein